MPEIVEDALRKWVPFLVVLLMQTSALIYWFGQKSQRIEDHLEVLQAAVKEDKVITASLDNANRELPVLSYRIGSLERRITKLTNIIDSLENQLRKHEINGGPKNYTPSGGK